MNDLRERALIFIHGFYGNYTQFMKIEEALEPYYTKIHNENYVTIGDKIEDMVDKFLKPVFEKFKSYNKIDIVTHSMGALLIRYYLSQNNCLNLGRVVMISPPNKGSDLTNLYFKFPFNKWLDIPVLEQLKPNSDFLLTLPPVNYEVGIIASTRTINPVFSAFIDGEDDGVVTLESMKLDNQKDYVEIDSSHLFVLFQDDTIQNILSFLKTGYFSS